MVVETSPPDHVSLCSLPLKGLLSGDGVNVVEGKSLRQTKSRCVINKVGLTWFCF